MRFREELISSDGHNVSETPNGENGSGENARADICDARNSEGHRRETRLEIQKRTTDAIDRIAGSIASTRTSTVSLVKEQTEIAKSKNDQREQLHELEVRKRKLEELAFLLDHKVITNDEFISRVRAATAD